MTLDDPEHVDPKLWCNPEDDPWQRIENPMVLPPDPKRAAPQL